VEAFALGVLLGLAIAVPVGPMAMLTIQLTLSRGVARGLASALGAATGDSLYGAVAALGLASVSEGIAAHQGWLRVGGGLFLCALGGLALRGGGAAPKREPAVGLGLGSAYLAGLLVTSTNPITVVTFSAILLQARSHGPALLVTFGVLVGSFLWYAALTAGAQLLRAQLERGMRWVHLTTVAVLLVGGLFSLLAGAVDLQRP
jgi:threonine/homoserine/homoserine lactone efflux protein